MLVLLLSPGRASTKCAEQTAGEFDYIEVMEDSSQPTTGTVVLSQMDGNIQTATLRLTDGTDVSWSQ